MYVKRPEDLNQQRKFPQLLCPCSVEEAACKCGNAVVFSVIFIENILTRCKIFFCHIFLFFFHHCSWLGLVQKWSCAFNMLATGKASVPTETLSELRIAVHRFWLSGLRSGMRTATVSPQLRWLSESTGFF